MRLSMVDGVLNFIIETQKFAFVFEILLTNWKKVHPIHLRRNVSKYLLIEINGNGLIQSNLDTGLRHFIVQVVNRFSSHSTFNISSMYAYDISFKVKREEKHKFIPFCVAPHAKHK